MAQVAAQPVLGVLDHAEDPPGEVCAQLGQDVREVAADVQQYK